MPISTCYRLIAGVLLLIQSSLVYSQNQPKPPGIDTLRLIAEEEQRRLIDPATGTVPYERLDEARRQLNSQPTTPNGTRVAQSGIPNITWQERGPSNVGGRTRALLFDPNDPTHKKVWAGSPAGGLWYTNDITDANAGWTPVSDNWENTVVTALAADPSNPQVMYAGTGDTYNYVTGGGIWKTTNGGTTWVRLSGSIPGGFYPLVSVALLSIQRIVVNSSGHVFAASKYGVVKSTDGGTSWSYSLDPAQSIGTIGVAPNPIYEQVTDLEIGSDGVLYAAFFGNTLYKSANGINWTNITPSDAPIGERTEMALAPTTSGAGQVIYCVSRAINNVNYGQDVKWFKKSTNGGITWTDLPIPTFSGGVHFTNGIGSAALNLVVHPTDANTVYAGGNDWFRSVNGGASWSNQLTSTYQYNQGLWFQPGSGTNAALITDSGILWSANWGMSEANPTISSRNNGYRVGEVSSVSMRSSAGSSYLMAGVQPVGYVQLTSPGLSTSNVFWNVTYPGTTFIDEDDPTLQLFQYYNSFYRNNSSGSTQITSINSYYSPTAADYDSQSNTLYVADITNGQAIIRKITNVGTTPVATTLTLAGITNLGNSLKLSPDRTKLLMSTSSGQLYRINNLGQSTPSVTAIDNGALPQSYISCLDVGANEDELLVTFSNYGTQSVWYTNNGGTTWTGKDQTNYDLPDVPVRSALFNPQNRKQVLLGTDAGVWSTDDITAANPGWAFSSSGMGTFRVNQLRYRASDGRITAATNGRGVWITDAFAIPYTLPSVSITNISNATLCAGNTFTVSFSTAGPAFGIGNTFEVWLSDANGSFANKLKIGSGTTSPITATLPSGSNAVPYGTNYQVKVIATNPDVESSQNITLAIGNLGNANLYDRRAEVAYYSSVGAICPGSQATLKVYAYDLRSAPTIADSYQWVLNNSPVSSNSSPALLAQQTGNYTVTLKQAGCIITSSTYTLNQYSIPTYPYLPNLSTSNDEPQCDDHPVKIITGYIGETANFQWARDGVAITGANSYSYSTTQTGSYSCLITENSCSFLTSPTYFQFGRSLYAKVLLNSNSDTLLCAASNYYSISMYASIPSANDYTIQWYRNGVLIPGATSVNYYASQPGAYSILLKQGSCQVYSNTVTIRLVDQLKASISTLYGSSKSTCPGESRYLYTNIYNANLQWQKDGLDIPGATNSSYIATVSGNYTLKITRGVCSAISDPLSFTFSNTIQPQITLTESCSDISLDVNIYNNSYKLTGYQYQWYRNGVLLNGVTGSNYYTYQSDRSGTYSVRVTNGSCTGLSKEVYVTGGNAKPLQPVIANNTPNNLQLCHGNISQLLVYSSRGTLQWKRNGVPIPGATSTQFYATQSGIYSLANQDGNCTAESDPIEVKIGEATTATLNGNALISAGQSTLLPVSFTGPAPWSFTLTNGQSVTATYQNPAFIAVSPTSNTTYQLASVVNACGTGTVSGQASVSVGTGSADVSLNMVVSNRTPNVGDVVSYTLSAANAGPNNAVGVQLGSLLPAGISFVSTTSPEVSVTNGVVSANLGTIPANSISTVSFQAMPTQPGIFATAAQITSSQTPDPDSQPNSGTGDGQDDEASVDLRTPVGGSFVSSANPNQVPLPTVSGNQPAVDPNKADLSLAMQVDKLTPVVSQNDIVTTTLTVNNRGGSSASSVIVQVVLPNGSFSAQSPTGWIQVNSLTYKRYINSLVAGQSATLSLKWQPAGSGTLKAQILDLAEPDSDSTAGNGYTNGEDDEAAVTLRTQ